MQVKIIIGTISFMLAMMVLGYAAIRETARLERFTAARTGRQIEAGAHLYEQNCATCHGIHGKAEECFDASSGEPIGCVGLPLNNNALLCGDNTLRMQAMNWEGTKEAFIQSTLASGRPGTEMPTWSENFGGPMRADQIENTTKFILNYETEELCAEEVVVYDWQETYVEYSAEFPDGDAALGEELYLSYGCHACHGQMDDEESANVGPWLGDLAENAETRIDGIDGGEYVYESLLDPSAFIVSDCPTGPCTGPPSAMNSTFALQMSENPQDMQDLMAFILGE